MVFDKMIPKFTRWGRGPRGVRIFLKRRRREEGQCELLQGQTNRPEEYTREV